MVERRVRLLWVEGEDTAEYSDLIGSSGKLGRGDRGLLYIPENNGEWLSITKKRVVEKDGRIRVSTRLGNVFVFKALM